MTPAPDQALVPSQRAREAAANWIGRTGRNTDKWLADGIRSGERDELDFVSFLARFERDTAALATGAGEVREALAVCRDVLFSRIPRLHPEGPRSIEEQHEYEEVGGAWSMADRALTAAPSAPVPHEPAPESASEVCAVEQVAQAVREYVRGAVSIVTNDGEATFLRCVQAITSCCHSSTFPDRFKSELAAFAPVDRLAGLDGETVERLQRDIQMAAERLSIEGQLRSCGLVEEGLRSKMRSVAQDLFRALHPAAKASDGEGAR